VVSGANERVEACEEAWKMETNLEECTRKTVTCPNEEKVWRIWHVTDGVYPQSSNSKAESMHCKTMFRN
jgi:hypothetical protein